jgi:hypothetical protein
MHSTLTTAKLPVGGTIARKGCTVRVASIDTVANEVTLEIEERAVRVHKRKKTDDKRRFDEKGNLG